MHKYKVGIAVIFALGAAAVFAPPSTFAAANGTTTAKPSVLKGKLASYTPASRAIFWAKSAKVTVNLKFHTKLKYVGSNHAAPFPVAGDYVTVHVKTANGATVGTSMTYNDQHDSGSGDDGNEDGTSKFHGNYYAADSSATVLAVKNESGTVETFALTANTLYFQNGQQVAAPSLTDGERLRVEATQQSDGSWTANSVVIGDHKGDHGGQGENEDFSGRYVSNTDTTLTISDKHNSNQQTFTLDANTKYFDQNGQAVSSLTYSTGERLHVQATQQTDGTWLATSVGPEDSHGDGGCDHGGNGENHPFKGTYQSSDPESVTVTDEHGNTETFTVDANTLYFDQNGNQVSSLTYTAGETLYIRAVHQSDGSWLASAVSLKSQGDGHGGHESEDFHGAYSADTATSLTLLDEHGNSDAFTIDVFTEYVDQNGQPPASLTYTAGEKLRVEATQQADGSWLATMVSAFSGDGDGGGHH